jgi:hypothetical protein
VIIIPIHENTNQMERDRLANLISSVYSDNLRFKTSEQVRFFVATPKIFVSEDYCQGKLKNMYHLTVAPIIKNYAVLPVGSTAHIVTGHPDFSCLNIFRKSEVVFTMSTSNRQIHLSPDKPLFAKQQWKQLK